MSMTAELDSLSTVLSLKADTLNTFTKMWYSVFLWALVSSFVVHTVSVTPSMCIISAYYLLSAILCFNIFVLSYEKILKVLVLNVIVE